MATVINTPASQTSDGAAAGWAVAIVVLVAALLVALFVYPGFIRPAATQTQTPGANINVQLPASGGSDTSGSAGGTGSTGGTGGTQAPATTQ